MRLINTLCKRTIVEINAEVRHMAALRIAYSKRGGVSPICYPSGVTDQMVSDWKHQHWLAHHRGCLLLGIARRERVTVNQLCTPLQPRSGAGYR